MGENNVKEYEEFLKWKQEQTKQKKEEETPSEEPKDKGLSPVKTFLWIIFAGIILFVALLMTNTLGHQEKEFDFSSKCKCHCD